MRNVARFLAKASPSKERKLVSLLIILGLTTQLPSIKGASASSQSNDGGLVFKLFVLDINLRSDALLSSRYSLSIATIGSNPQSFTGVILRPDTKQVSRLSPAYEPSDDLHGIPFPRYFYSEEIASDSIEGVNPWAWNLIPERALGPLASPWDRYELNLLVALDTPLRFIVNSTSVKLAGALQTEWTANVLFEKLENKPDNQFLTKLGLSASAFKEDSGSLTEFYLVKVMLTTQQNEILSMTLWYLLPAFGLLSFLSVAIYLVIVKGIGMESFAAAFLGSAALALGFLAWMVKISSVQLFSVQVVVFSVDLWMSIILTLVSASFSLRR